VNGAGVRRFQSTAIWEQGSVLYTASECDDDWL